MRKISKVELKNFRIFTDEGGDFDFNNNQGLPSDFVCIYGQNGMGKTSFFDGIEWVSYVKIYRFEEKSIKKEMDKYIGDIIKNRNSDNNSDTYVKVKFSDSTEITRKRVKRKNSLNDYGKGSFSPKKYDDLIIDKQILPHSKIDGFVSAKSPMEKYTEWGNFWDYNGRQREIFENIYKVNKAYAKEIESLKEQLGILEEDINNFTIDDEKLIEFNESINMFNMINPLEISFPYYIKKDHNKISNLPDKVMSERYSNILISLGRDCSLDTYKINYLLKFYKSYFEENRVLVLKQYRLLYEDMIKGNQIYKLGEQWFKEYLNNKNISLNLKKNNEQLALKEIDLKKVKDDFKSINKRIDREKIEFDELNLKRNYFSEESEKIKINIEPLKSLKSKKEQQLNTSIELSNNYEKLINIFDNMIFEDKSENFQTHLDLCKYDINQLKHLKDIYQPKIKAVDNEIVNINKKINEMTTLYNNQKTNTDNIKKILIEIKSYIEKNNIHICPVCKSDFHDMNQLLNKVSLSEQEKYCEKLYNELLTFKLEKEKIITARTTLIFKWNSECINFKENIKKLNTENSTKIIELKSEITEISSKINIMNNKLEELKSELNYIIKYEGDFSKESLKKWFDEIELNYKKRNEILINQKSNINKNIDILSTEVSKIKSLIETIRKDYDIFNDNDMNLKNVAILKEIENADNIKIDKWSTFKEYYDSLEERVKYLEKKLINIENKIKDFDIKYNSFDIPIEFEKDIFDRNRYEEYMLDIGKGNSFSLDLLILNQKEMIRKKNDIDNKSNLLEYIDKEICNSEYNNKYKQMENEIAKIKSKITDYTYKKEKINNIFSFLKQCIENNIEKTLGSKSMNQIYSIIEPNKQFEKLSIEVNFNNDDIPELYIKGANDTKKEYIIPEYFFSSAQLNTVALSMFLGGALSSEGKINTHTIFIDDPVGHFDDINVLAFVDLLRNIIREGKWQIILSTHDESFYNLLKNKLSPEYYNSKFIKFQSTGKIINDI